MRSDARVAVPRFLEESFVLQARLLAATTTRIALVRSSVTSRKLPKELAEVRHALESVFRRSVNSHPNHVCLRSIK